MSFVLKKMMLLDQRWTYFIISNPSSMPFHHPAWAGLLAECYGYRAFALALSDDAGQIVAGLPIMVVRGPLGGRRWVSLPFTDCCPPLLKDGTHLEALIDALVQQGEDHAVKIEVRVALPERHRVYSNAVALIHTLELASDPEAVFRKFKRTKVQQRIHKSQRDGVTVRRAESLADMRVFYALHLQVRRRLGTPVQSWRFFKLLWQQLMEQGLGFLLLAYHNAVPIAGSIFLASNGTVIYKYSASNPTYWRLCPNNLVVWTAIKWGCENGYHTFNFGRTDLDDEGSRNFKNGWGAREEPLIYSVIADRPPKRTSEQVSPWISALVRRSPVVICRMLGELFYKYGA